MLSLCAILAVSGLNGAARGQALSDQLAGKQGSDLAETGTDAPVMPDPMRENPLAAPTATPAPEPTPTQNPADVDMLNPAPAASPAPARKAPEVDMQDAEGYTPAPRAGSVPVPIAPPVETGLPGPGGEATALVADSVPLPEEPNPAMLNPYSEFDLAQVETPLFINNAINDFGERPLYLTGNWSVKPHLTIGSFYDGNIFVRSNDSQGDLITRIAPGLLMRLGNDNSIFYLTADYTAGINLYAQHSNEDSVDEDASTTFQWSLPKTTIALRLGVSADSGADIDATNLVRQQLYFAGLTTHYALSEKTSIDLNGDYSRSDFDGLISSSQVDAAAYVNYAFSPRTQVGAGVAGGYVIVPGEGHQEYEEFNLRATYRLSGKVTLLADGGIEDRQYSLGAGDTTTPVFDISAAWDVRNGTQVTLGFQRQIFVSAIEQNQDYTASSVSLGVSQRITDSVSASLSLAFINSEYSATASGVSATREDNFMTIRPAVQWQALSWLSIGIFYEYSQNFSSGLGADSFSRDRGGVEMAILF